MALLNEEGNAMTDEPIEEQLSLPGEPRSGLIPVANTYRVTIERDDGYQLTEHEARTVLQIAAEPQVE